MLKYKNTSLFILLGLMMVALLAANSACAGEKVAIPPGTAAVVFIGENGKVLGVANGKGARPDMWCAMPGHPEAGKLQEKFKIPKCELKKDVTVNRGEPIDVFYSQQNPCYITLYIGGQQVTIPVPPQYCP